MLTQLAHSISAIVDPDKVMIAFGLDSEALVHSPLYLENACLSDQEAFRVSKGIKCCKSKCYKYGACTGRHGPKLTGWRGTRHVTTPEPTSEWHEPGWI